MAALSPEYNLLVIYTDVAKEWHPIKNGSLRPEHFTPFNQKKAWWLCGKGHEWEAVIASRTRMSQGCPYCSGRRPLPEYNLLVVFPDVAAQWHPTRNGTDTPSEYTLFSNKKFWWLCNKGHEWERPINGRTSKTRSRPGCPVCFRHKYRGYRTGGSPPLKNQPPLFHID
jgi:starvation-inducible outer membrane lipoprotein